MPKDVLGNHIRKGDLIHYKPPADSMLIGEVIETTDGAIVMGESGQPATITFVMKMKLGTAPRMPIPNVVVVRHPKDDPPPTLHKA